MTNDFSLTLPSTSKISRSNGDSRDLQTEKTKNNEKCLFESCAYCCGGGEMSKREENTLNLTNFGKHTTNENIYSKAYVKKCKHLKQQNIIVTYILLTGRKLCSDAIF